MRVVRWVPGSLFLLGLAAIAPACERKAATEYIAGFSTQVQVPREFRTLEYSVYAYSADSPQGVMVECHKVEVVDGKARLPKTLGVNQEKTDAPNMMVTVVGYKQDLATVESFRGDCEQPVTIEKNNPNNAARILRKSRQAYRNGKILYLPMPLKYACFDVPCANPEETCVGGRCAKVQRDQRAFKEYSPEAVFGDSSTCFSMKRCLSDATIPTVEDANTCTYSVPGTVEGMNVRVIFDGYVTEVLDVDPPPPPDADDALKADFLDHEEGYTNLGNGRFRLAKGLCDATKADSKAPHRIVSIVASRSCPAKSPNQPVCDEGSEVLIPAPSKLYVLVDRSAPMRTFFEGEKAVEEVLKLSIDDPVFSTTDIAFHWLPGAGNTVCPGATSFLNLGDPNAVQYTPTLTARELIIDRFKKQSTTDFPATAPAIEALSAGGAYSTLLNAPNADRLNRRAIVLITNNDVGLGCSGENVIDALKSNVEAARAAGIFTYVIKLKQPGEGPPETDPANKARNDNATTVANAGGTVVAIDDGNGLAAPKKLSELVTDLSSCLYERPGSITDGSKTTLSILGQSDVKFDGACIDASSNADGWNFSGPTQGLIRICGASCTKLRENLTRLREGATGLSLQEKTVVRAQPIFVTATQSK